MEGAVTALNSAKRWVESSFSETRPRIDDCERFYTKFKAEYDSKSAALKGSPAEAEWAKYREALDGRFADLKANDDAGMLAQQGRSALRWVESFSKEKKAEQAEKYLKDLQKVVSTLQETRFARSSEATTFLKDVAPQMPTLTSSVTNMATLVNMENDLYPFQSLMRGGFDRAVSGGVDRAQKVLQDAQNDVDKFKAKYGSHPSGIELLKPIEEKMASVRLAINGQEADKRAEQDNKKAEQEKLAAAAAAKQAQDAAAKAAADKAAAAAASARAAEAAKAAPAAPATVPVTTPKPVSTPVAKPVAAAVVAPVATPPAAKPVAAVVTSSGSAPPPEQVVSALNSQKRWLENAFGETNVRITDCENYYNKFVKLYDEKKALLKGTTAEAEWANYTNALLPRYEDLKANDEASLIAQATRDCSRQIQSSMTDKRTQQAQRSLEKLKQAVTTLHEPRFARSAVAQKFLKDFEPGLAALDELVENGSLREEMQQELSSSINYCTRGGLERAFSGGANEGQTVLEGMQSEVDAFKAKFGTHPLGLEILAPIEEKIKEYWVKIHAMDAGRMAEKAKEAAKAQEMLNEFIDVLPPPIRDCIRNKKCTFSVTDKQGRKQPYYTCNDCENAVYVSLVNYMC